MKFKEDDKVILVDAHYFAGAENGDKAIVLGVSESGETLHVHFNRWYLVGTPLSTRLPTKMLTYGKPYYVIRAHRFIHDCMFSEGVPHNESGR